MKVWQPRPYQVQAAEHALYNPGAGLFLRPGLGKTSVSLAVVQTLQEEKMIRGTLVIAPLRVAYSVWPAEVQKWSQFAGLSVGVLWGKEKARVLRADNDIYTINPEGLDWLFTQLATMKTWPFDNLIIDESTKFKNHKGKRWALVRKALSKFKRSLILTGTPAGNGLQDLFGQVYLIDEGQRLGRFVTHFRKQFFAPELIRIGGGQTITKWHATPTTAERIKDQIKDVCLYMSDVDHLKLPPLTFNTIPVTLPGSLMADYRKLEDQLYAKIGGRDINIVSASAASIKLRQFLGGQVYTEDGGAVHVHSAKMDALEDLIEEAAGSPVLVAVQFKHESVAIQRMLRAKFDIHAPYLGDGINPKLSDAVCRDWNAGKLPVVLAHPASVGHGLNMQESGHTIVWFTLTWSYEDYDQLIRRLYRSGQMHGVVVHHIVVEGTKDADVVAALTSKNATQQTLLDALKKGNK